MRNRISTYGGAFAEETFVDMPREQMTSRTRKSSSSTLPGIKQQMLASIYFT